VGIACKRRVLDVDRSFVRANLGRLGHATLRHPEQLMGEQ